MTHPKDRPSLAVVLNITPNSNFCERIQDGSHFQQQLKNLKSIAFEKNIKIITDIGAESTSPLNDKISFDEEMKRLDETLGVALREESFPFEYLTLSLDTYRPETFGKILGLIKNKSQLTEVIWNDVSGCYQDPSVLYLLKENPNLKYVVGHNPAGLREISGDHLKFANTDQSSKEKMKEVALFFKSAYNFFKEKKLIDQVIFDPCFSFGKTKSQTQYLAFHLKDLISQLPTDVSWMIGASRKSFLRQHLDVIQYDNKETVLQEMEHIHFHLLVEWQKAFQHQHIIYRVHDPDLFLLSKKTYLL